MNVLRSIIKSDDVLPWSSIFAALVLRFILFALLFPLSGLPLVFLYLSVGLFVVFILHAFLSERFRSFTFVLLRFSKGLVPYVFLLLGLPYPVLFLVVATLTVISSFYTVEYARRKMGRCLRRNIYEMRYGWVRFVAVLLVISLSGVGLPLMVLFAAVLALHHILLAFLVEVKRLILGR